jgi:hypothetical protein
MLLIAEAWSTFHPLQMNRTVGIANASGVAAAHPDLRGFTPQSVLAHGPVPARAAGN